MKHKIYIPLSPFVHKSLALEIHFWVVLCHVIVQTRFLHERLAAHLAHFPPVSRVDPLVQVQGRLPQERLLAEPALVILHRLVLELMLVHTFEAKRFVLAKLAFVPLAHHVEVVYVLSELHFRVENPFASVAFESIVNVVHF